MLTSIRKFSSSIFVAALITTLTPQMVQAEAVGPVLDQNVLKEISIANFQQVNGTILRGAAPSEKNLRLLAKSGVKTILDLRMSGPAVTHESALAHELGFNYVHVPLGFTSPNTPEMTRILAVLNEADKQPVYVHCRQGADRTGMTIGMYRRIHDKWEFKQTYGEMRKHHFKPVLLGMKSAVKSCLDSPNLVASLMVPVEKTLTASESSQTKNN
ncbi:MAG: tyrosine-protein phosphatase [Candidatus Melainabacteria bacterium]|nr:tyrosine-protein phosphatase [Candidatus Melainabacteria bacterium]